MFRFLQRTKKKTSYPVAWGCYRPCLVVEPYPSEKYEFVSWDYEIPNIWENKTCSKPPTRNGLLHFSWHSDALQLLHVTSGCPNASHSNLETVDGAFCTSASWCSRLGFLDSLLHSFFVQSGSSFRDWDQLTSTNKKSTVCKLLLLLESNVKRKDSEMTFFPEVIWRMWQSHAKPPIFHGKNYPFLGGWCMIYGRWLANRASPFTGPGSWVKMIRRFSEAQDHRSTIVVSHFSTLFGILFEHTNRHILHNHES